MLSKWWLSATECDASGSAFGYAAIKRHAQKQTVSSKIILHAASSVHEEIVMSLIETAAIVVLFILNKRACMECEGMGIGQCECMHRMLLTSTFSWGE